ncbi:DUF2335 domain-containing protein [Palleniella muris]|uniref:DUF2335 domain-containing protein n=1 Tax=Palleniella muris TaxID=3038145 RepID=A0AC61QM49_9BACT|nr:DUF2335 domain-containing protein [Palleniella muris]
MKAAFYALEQKVYSGPLPAPEDFAQYEKTLPGATDCILRMTERQIEYRIKQEDKIIDGKLKMAARGQYL